MSVIVRLAGQEYQVEPLRMAPARAWRQQFEAPFRALTAALAGAGEIDLTNGAALADLLGTLSANLIGSVDLVLDMLFAYAPTLAADRARIEAEGYDAEALAAFVEVLKQAYPFGSLLTALRPPPGPPARKT